MWTLNFISEENFRNHVCATIEKYGEKLESFDLKHFNKNLIDPIKLIFDKTVYQSSWEQIVNNEIFRQRDKSNNNDIGYFHQRVFQYIKDCRVPDNGKDGEIIGHIMYVRAEIKADDGRSIPIMTFGPISIAPEYKRKGYGKALLDFSLDKAKALGVGAICMEGDIRFYGKSGFVVASTRNIHYYAEPKEEVVPYFLLKELQEGFLDGIAGTYQTPQGYFVDEKKAEMFDANFPLKKKLKLPGQLV